MALTGMSTGAVPATLATIRVLAAVTPPSPEMGRSSPPPAVHRSGCSRANNGEVWRRIQSEWLILSRPVLPWPGLDSIRTVVGGVVDGRFAHRRSRRGHPNESGNQAGAELAI